MLRIRTDYYVVKHINFVKLRNCRTDRSRAKKSDRERFNVY